MSSKIGIGVIGCGTISDIYLTNLTQNYKNVEVLAVADLYLEKAQQAKEKFNIPKACTVEELLAMEDISIVCNLTIPAAHYSVNKQILEAGKHVYCEKPLTLSLEDAKEITALAKEKGLMAVSAPDTFLGAGAQTCRALLDEDAIGTPVGFTANMTCAGHELWHPAPGFYYKKGGGPMFDMGPYYLTTLVSLLGPVRKISCFATSGRPVRNILGTPTETEVPTHYTAIVEFVCGATGTMNMSFDVWNSDLPCMEIYGTKGSMSVPDPNGFSGPVSVFDGEKLQNIVDNYNENPPVPVPPRLFAMITQSDSCKSERELLYPAAEDPRTNMRGLGVSDMAQALLEGRSARLSPDISLHVVEALNAFEISANTGTIYEMTTTCERPEPMKRGLALYEV